MMNSGAVDLAKAQDFIQKAVSRQALIGDEALRGRISLYWGQLWNRYKKNPAYLNWHLQLLYEAAAYPGMVDSSLFDTALSEAYDLIPAPARGEQNLNSLILLARLSTQMGDTALKNKIVDRIYADAAATMSPQAYKALEPQLNAFVESLQ